MFLNKFLLIGGGVAAVGGGTGLGVYYGTKQTKETKDQEKAPVLGNSRENPDGITIPKKEKDMPPKAPLKKPEK